MLRSTLAAAALCLAVSTYGAHGQAVAPSGQEPGGIASLHAKAARDGGKVRIIVEFGAPAASVPVSGPRATSPAFVSAMREAQQDLIATHFADGASRLSGPDRSLTRMDFTPQFAVNATAAEITRLTSDPRVVRIHEDKLARPTLRQSLALMKMTGTGGAYSLPGGGAKGQGRAVAVLDTGASKLHEFLKNKVISEACYNSNVSDFGSVSRCPAGVPASVAVGSGADCQPSAADGCGHGTHVSGIAAGANTSPVIPPNEPIVGVAASGRLVVINVFSRFKHLHPSRTCGAAATRDCLLSFDSDQIKGLERVFALRNGVVVGRSRFKIDAVNMSLGGGGSTGFCNTDPLKPIIDTLRSVGIATVIASGNNGFINGVSAPGCIQTAITVGASTKRARGFPERMAFYSNQGPQVDTLAPGGDTSYPPVPVGTTNAILSSVVSGGYDGFQGTSMAAPHVAGAIAAIRSRPACRTKTVTQIENALATTGPVITDHRIVPGLKERRIDVPALMVKLGCFS